MRKNEVIKDLENSIESEHTITCCQCRESHTASGVSANDFAEDKYNEGWRIIDQAPACPKCK